MTGQLPTDRTTPTQHGVLFAATTDPTTADGLEPLSHWLPQGSSPPTGPTLIDKTPSR